MIGIQPLCIAAFSFLAFSFAAGTEIDIQFNIVESTRTETISYSTGDTSRQTMQHHGNMTAVLTFDPTEQRPVAIRFTGGVLNESPSSFTNTANVFFNGVGTKKVTIVQSATGLQMRVNTVGPAHYIDSNGWILETERILTFPIAGTLSAKITIDGRTETQTIDVATNPPDNIEPSIGTEIRLQVFETENHGSASDYKITFNTSLSASHVEKIPGTDTTYTSTTSGTTIAEAYFSGPNRFGQWLLHNGYNLIDEHSTNRSGVHLAVLYAFGLSANNNPGLPWSFESELGSLVLTLGLPDSGIDRAVQVESCDDLRTGNWEALNAVDFIDGNSNLDQRATGERRIRFPTTGSRFYRVVPSGFEN